MFIVIDKPNTFLASMPEFGTFETPIDGVITGVHDGDNVTANKTYLRLLAVDCPETFSPPYVMKAQPMGKEVGDFVRDFCKGKTAKIYLYGKDKYMRQLAKVVINDTDVSAVLLEKGFAWYLSTPVFEDRLPYRILRDKAKKAKLGIWGTSTPAVKPSEWRKMYAQKF